jgi:hypothetical protein
LNAEFTVGKNVVAFQVGLAMREDMTVGPPLRLAISARKCNKSPVLVYALAYDHVDAEREVAVYRVLEVVDAATQ